MTSPDPRAPMTPEEEEALDRWDCVFNLYSAKGWAERREFNELSDEFIRLGSPPPDSGHEFWRVKWLPGGDPQEDSLFDWARRKALELKPGIVGLDWVALTTRLYEDDVMEEASRLVPGFSDDVHPGPGLVFFHLMGLIS